MEKRLVLAVKRIRNAVIGYVVKQDEALRGEGSLAEIEGFEIKSLTNPELDDSTLYVRGDNLSADNNTFCYNCETLAEAEKIVQSIKLCVAKINAVKSVYSVEDGFEIIE